MKNNDLFNKPQWQHIPRSSPDVVINTSLPDKEDNEGTSVFVPVYRSSLSRLSLNSIDQPTPDLFLEKIEKKLSLVFVILILELIISLITALALVF